MPTKEELEMLQLMPQDASRQSQSQHQPEESRCFLCKLVIDPSTNPGRVLTRSAYEIYGNFFYYCGFRAVIIWILKQSSPNAS